VAGGVVAILATTFTAAMGHTMSAAALLAEATTTSFEHADLPSKWFFGGVALAVLLLLLLIVTRFNVDR
jgi:hypothetical protein